MTYGLTRYSFAGILGNYFIVETGKLTFGEVFCAPGRMTRGSLSLVIREEFKVLLQIMDIGSARSTGYRQWSI